MIGDRVGFQQRVQGVRGKNADIDQTLRGVEFIDIVDAVGNPTDGTQPSYQAGSALLGELPISHLGDVVDGRTCRFRRRGFGWSP